MQKGEIKALIQLLDDTDDFVLEQVEEKLIEIGPQVIEQLEAVWESTIDENHRENIELVIDRIYETTIYDKLKLWIASEEKNILEGAILVAQVQYPEINATEINARIETIKTGIWLELKQNLTPMEKINTFNQMFFTEYGFSGSLTDIYDSKNNFIHLTLERKTGSPIMLGILYLGIAQALDIPLFGINLPYHFSLAYCKYKRDENDKFYANRQQDVIFYVNPMSKGLIFGKQDIKNYLERIGVEDNSEYYKPVSNKQCIYALIQHILFSQKETKESLKYDQFEHLKELFQ